MKRVTIELSGEIYAERHRFVHTFPGKTQQSAFVELIAAIFPHSRQKAKDSILMILKLNIYKRY